LGEDNLARVITSKRGGDIYKRKRSLILKSYKVKIGSIKQMPKRKDRQKMAGLGASLSTLLLSKGRKKGQASLRLSVYILVTVDNNIIPELGASPITGTADITYEISSLGASPGTVTYSNLI